MTDKQIIIDVSKCKECGLRNCEGNLIYWCHTYDDHCKDFDNCYYKQLKRKEQECERLKSDYFTVIQQRNIAEQRLDQLKTCLTEIKEIANSDNHYFSDGTILRYEVVNKILEKISEVVE